MSDTASQRVRATLWVETDDLLSNIHVLECGATYVPFGINPDLYAITLACTITSAQYAAAHHLLTLLVPGDRAHWWHLTLNEDESLPALHGHVLQQVVTSSPPETVTVTFTIEPCDEQDGRQWLRHVTYALHHLSHA